MFSAKKVFGSFTYPEKFDEIPQQSKHVVVTNFSQRRALFVSTLPAHRKWKYRRCQSTTLWQNCKMTLGQLCSNVIPTLWQCHKVGMFQCVSQHLHNMAPTPFQLIFWDSLGTCLLRTIVVSCSLCISCMWPIQTHLHEKLLCISYHSLLSFIQLCSHITSGLIVKLNIQ